VDFVRFAQIAQAFAGILTGLIAVLGVPLALRQVINLQRELRRYEEERLRRFDASANLVITADYSLTRPAVPGRRPPVEHPSPTGTTGVQPSPPAQVGKRVLRLDLTLKNVGEGSVDVLACLVAARSLDRLGEEVAAEGRDAQWDDLTRHYWDNKDDWLSPGLSTTKHVVYAPDALARVKPASQKILSRIDQIHDFQGEVYLLYRVFVAARRSVHGTTDVETWTALQRSLLNINAPAFREASAEPDPLGLVATPNGWRLFLHYYEALSDPKLRLLRTQADREQAAVTDPVEYERTRLRLDAELQAYCRRTLLPAWKAYRADLEHLENDPPGIAALLASRRFQRRQREIDRVLPWDEQELWTEYYYVTLEAD
jgi:hypothetical protein